MKWLKKEINNKIIYFMDIDNPTNPRVTIRQLPSGKYIMEDKLLEIKKESFIFNNLTTNFLSDIVSRHIELKFLQDNVDSISWDNYIDDTDTYYIKEVRRFLVTNYSRSKKNRMRLKELDDGTYLFKWNYQGSLLEIHLNDKDNDEEKDNLLKEIQTIFKLKENELNNVLNLFKEA